MSEGKGPSTHPSIAWAEVTIDYCDTERAAILEHAPWGSSSQATDRGLVSVSTDFSWARCSICNQCKRRNPVSLELIWTFGSMTSRASIEFVERRGTVLNHTALKNGRLR